MKQIGERVMACETNWMKLRHVQYFVAATYGGHFGCTEERVGIKP
jgi:hypothetical protein